MWTRRCLAKVSVTTPVTACIANLLQHGVPPSSCDKGRNVDTKFRRVCSPWRYSHSHVHCEAAATGTLREHVAKVANGAATSGSLLKLATIGFLVPDTATGQSFVVSLRDKVAEGARKANATAGTRASPAAKPCKNPFIDPEKDLVVDPDFTEGHYLILNKFPVVDHHVLVVTKKFECQTDMPNESDFAAIWQAMTELDAVTFYNCGGLSGASQAHKHFQLLPLESLADQLKNAGGTGQHAAIPVVAALEKDKACSKAAPMKPMMLSHWAPLFRHAVARLPDDANPLQLLATYEAVLAACGISPSRDGTDRTHDVTFPSHNLIITKKWMVVMPRVHDPAPGTGVGVNGCGLLGFLLVKDRSMLDNLVRVGPSTVLADVGRAP